MKPALNKLFRNATSLILVSGSLWCPCGLLAQGGSAGTAGRIEPRYMIDMPTAGMQPGRSFAVDVDVYDEGGMLFRCGYGLLDRLSLAVSFGGTHLVGSESPVMNAVPGLAIKLRIVEEAFAFPAIAVGFDTQGKDAYRSDFKRYEMKSPGVYGVCSKNYLLLGYFSLHAGVNYSFENADGDKDINFFFGAEKSLGPFLSIIGEYNAAMNDSDHSALGKGRGYLSFALDAGLGGGVTLGINIKDVFENQRGRTEVLRTLHLEYVH